MRALEFAQQLMAHDSVSHRSNRPITELIDHWLDQLGFARELLTYRDAQGEEKCSLVAKRGPGSGGVAYLGHTDVVPASQWTVPFCGPFEPTVRDDRLWGRGACDMKGSIGAALAAIEQIPLEQQRAPIYVICTADEEVGMAGAQQVAEQSRLFSEMVADGTVGIIGEPTNLEVVHCHKGGLMLRLTSRGITAHSSQSDGINANDRLLELFPELAQLQRRTREDLSLRDSSFDPPTLSWNMVIENHPIAVNVTTGLAVVRIFMRTMPAVDHRPLVEQLINTAERLGIETLIEKEYEPWGVATDSPHIVKLLELTGSRASHAVPYGTDAGKLQSLKQLVVCGPGDVAQAHRSDEWISLEQLSAGTGLYLRSFLHWAT